LAQEARYQRFAAALNASDRITRYYVTSEYSGLIHLGEKLSYLTLHQLPGSRTITRSRLRRRV